MFHIRDASTADIPELKELFINTILSVNLKDYSIEEVTDWASCGKDILHWKKLLEKQYYIVAQNKSFQIVGFASINKTGYLHSMFVHKNFQNRGIAQSLYNTLELFARKEGVKKITSEVSITAKPFFEKQGFIIDEKQRRKANKLQLVNYKMSKEL